MDRRCKFFSLIGAAFVVASASAAPLAGIKLRASRWLPQERQIEALSFELSECLSKPSDPEATKRVAMGRAAFRSPLLLGGQAARAGVSCDSCHRNGHGNPDFQFPGLSGASGTADVTSSVMSSHRDDGNFNPVPIPDLSGSADTLKVSRSDSGAMLKSFIRGLIVEEFDGAEPSALTLDSITQYVQALSPNACPPSARMEPITLQGKVLDVQSSVRAANFAMESDDREAARLMLASARAGLGLIHERYGAPDLAHDRRILRNADTELAGIQDAIDAGEDNVEIRVIAWLARTAEWSGPLARHESLSLFASGRLASSLQGQAADATTTTDPIGHQGLP